VLDLPKLLSTGTAVETHEKRLPGSAGLRAACQLAACARPEAPKDSSADVPSSVSFHGKGEGGDFRVGTADAAGATGGAIGSDFCVVTVSAALLLSAELLVGACGASTRAAAAAAEATAAPPGSLGSVAGTALLAAARDCDVPLHLPASCGTAG